MLAHQSRVEQWVKSAIHAGCCNQPVPFKQSFLAHAASCHWCLKTTAKTRRESGRKQKGNSRPVGEFISVVVLTDL